MNRQNRDVRRSVSLDAETDKLWGILARPYEDNRSQVLRKLIREAALGKVGRAERRDGGER